jgi:DNA-directed RNA polymerase subunit omega
MSLVQPPIDKLLERTGGDKFLLCTVASKRAHDINDMMHSQQERATALQHSASVAEFTGKKPLSLAMTEIADDEVAYAEESLKLPKDNVELDAEIDAELEADDKATAKDKAKAEKAKSKKAAKAKAEAEAEPVEAA